MGWNKPGYIRKQRLKRAKREMTRIITKMIKLQAESCCNEPGSCQGEKGQECNGGVCTTENHTH